MSPLSSLFLVTSVAAGAPNTLANNVRDSCVDYINSYRARSGLYALGGTYDAGCEYNDAVYDCTHGFHKSFGQCGEGGQCEADCSSCQQAVDMFYAEGPGGGHYEIMMSSQYGSVFWGVSEGCAEYGNNFYTFNFYGNGKHANASQHPTVGLKSVPQVATSIVAGPKKNMSHVGDSCVDYINSYRARSGLYALGGTYDTGCEYNDAVYDCTHGFHKSFGQCGEGGQCEADCSSCQQAVDMFYAEGPGGGHYEIMMSSQYGSVFWGVSEGCAEYGNNFYTFNFYGNFNNANASQHPAVGLKSVPQVATSIAAGPKKNTSNVGDSCVDYINSYRARSGLYALGGTYDTGCEYNDAVYDCTHGFHKSFGQCGEGGQCEADCSSCQQAVDMFYAEGPGGGHYEIMMSSQYGSVFWGVSEGCAEYGNNFYTFNFYGNFKNANASQQHPPVGLKTVPHVVI